jgi:chorismate dehydratase
MSYIIFVFSAEERGLHPLSAQPSRPLPNDPSPQFFRCFSPRTSHPSRVSNSFGIRFLRTLPFSVSCNSFICHSYKNTGGVYQLFPFRHCSLATRHSSPSTILLTPFFSASACSQIPAYPGPAGKIPARPEGTSSCDFRLSSVDSSPLTPLLYFCLRERNAHVTTLRISVVQYLNTAPLVWGFTHGPLRGKYELSFTVPSQCAEALRTGAADIAIIPAIEYQRIEGLVVLPDLAIASKQQVRSLLIVSKKPIEQARRIALDRSSRSTQALTRILCAERWKIAPEFFETPPDAAAMLREADAALVIGDPALRLSIAIEGAAQPGPSGELVCKGASAGIASAETLHVYDIVEEWRKLTGLPAVLAIWAARREVATPEVVADFTASREYGVARIAEIAAEAAQEEKLPAPALDSYLRNNISFTLDEENRRGLDLYYQYAAKLGLIPRARPVEWAGTPSKSLRAPAK